MGTGAGSTKKYVFGVKIYVGSYAGTTDADIGLYVSGGIGWFRWIENSITTTDTWKSGYLVGIGRIGQSSDFKDGGNLAQVKGTEIRVANVDSTQTTSFWKKIETAGISLIGLRCDIVEFDASASPATETVIFRGVCEEAVNFNEGEYTISLRNSFYKRRANLSTVIDNNTQGLFPNSDDSIAGSIVPISFGTHLKCKMVRTANKTDVFELSKEKDFGGDITASDNNYLVSPFNIFFPIVGCEEPLATPQEIFWVQVGTNVKWYNTGVEVTTGEIDLTTYFSDKCIHVIEGANEGQFRLIKAATVDLDREYGGGILAGNVILIETSMVFESSFLFTATEKSVVSIKKINREYMADVWDCIGMLDNDLTALVGKETKLYTYSDEKNVVVPASITVDTRVPVDETPSDYIKLPEYSYIASGTGNNKISIDVKLFNTDVDTLSSYLIYPVTASLINESNLRKWNLPTWARRRPGVYSNLDSGSGGPVSGTLANISDRTYTSNYGFSHSTKTAYAIDLKLPTLPDDFLFDEFFLLMKIRINALGGGTTAERKINIIPRRFWAAMDSIKYEYNVTTGIEINFDTFPEFYFTDSPSDNKEKNFYFVKNTALSNLIYYNTGYSTVKFDGIDTKDIYESILSLGFFYFHTAVMSSGQPGYQHIFMYEMAIMFKKNISVKKEIYTPFSGRIYDDTWSDEWRSRKTAANLMESPVDIAEHILRLQNFSEEGDVKNYGKEYCPNALINTATTEGGFDYSGLDPVRTNKAAAQFFDYEKCWSDELLKSICQQYDLCIFQNTAGNECINYIGSYKTTPSVTVTYADVLPDSVGDVEEQHVDTIYCEPVVYYNYNYGSKKFDNVIKITNSNASAFDASYVTGYKGDEAETLWGLSNALWNKYRIRNDPPAHLTECVWVRSEADAKRYLYNWFRRMGVYTQEGTGVVFSPKKWVPFSVPYEKSVTIGASHTPWFVSMHLLLNLPHQTNAQDTQCVIESIDFDPENNKTDVTVIMMDRTSEIDLYIENSFDSYATVGWEDWENTFKTKAEEPSNEYDVEKIY